MDRKGFSDADLIDFTPNFTAAEEVASHYVMGPLFTSSTIIDDSPNGKKGTLSCPVTGAPRTGIPAPSIRKRECSTRYR